MKEFWLILLLVAPVFVEGNNSTTTVGPIISCPRYWQSSGNSCYRVYYSSKTWEDSNNYCQSFPGGSLVAIENRDENNFIRYTLLQRARRDSKFWIGLFRNSSSSDASVGWAWLDGTEPQFKNWAWTEPNNWNNQEKCGEIYKNGKWNDFKCASLRPFICERPKGVLISTTPTSAVTTAVPDTTSDKITCELGWKRFRHSCYKITSVKRTWNAAKQDCANLGGHLLKIDDSNEQNYFYHEIKGILNSRFWIGLYDPQGTGNWQWESDDSSAKFANWYQYEPNGIGTEKCVEMYGGRLAAKWNDHYCYIRAQYICEKEWKSVCPDGWTLFGDSCYQFNLAESQLKNWTAARDACHSVGDFSSLVSIHNETEQNFLKETIASVAKSAVWIGLNDKLHEYILKWSDNSKLDYTNWIDNITKVNRGWKDCSVLLGMRTDGAWTMEKCSEPRRYICKRKKALFKCDAPLGMENGNIKDDQLSAKDSLSLDTAPSKSRLRGDSKWCPKSDGDYLQIDLGHTYSITNIYMQGLATAYCLYYGNDGNAYKPYGTQASSCEELTSEASDKPHVLKGLRKFIARFIRITPTKGGNKCVRLELYGCLSESQSNPSFKAASWKSIPSTSIQYQINLNQLSWTDARSYCMDQKADLLSISTGVVAQYMSMKLNSLNPWSFWIGLSERDYSSIYYWSDGSPVNYVAWESGYPRSNAGSYSCVMYQRRQSSWKTAYCDGRKPFVCMRKDSNSVQKIKDDVVGNGITGVWMSSATYYWPLSVVSNAKIFGTVNGKAYGNIKVVSGVKNVPNSALQFSKSGMYIDVPLEEQDCLTLPDVCPWKHLTLSFMASFDNTAANWNRKVVILDSLGDNEKSSTGISVYVEQNKLWFVVSYANFLWKVRASIQGDNVWRHYVMTCSSISISLTINGKSVDSRAYVPNLRKSTQSKDMKKNFHIGLQANSKVTSGAVSLAMLGFWDRILSSNDIKTIYNTEFGWCPNGWTPFGMSCYQFTSDWKSWSDARAQCQSLGGDLTTISTLVEQAFITDRVQMESWIGLSETKPRRRYLRYTPSGWAWPRRRYAVKSALKFFWANSAPAVYTNWRHHTSFLWRSYSYDVTCVSVVMRSGLWKQLACSSRKAAVCEKEKDETMPAANITVVNSPKFTRVCQFSEDTLSCPSGSVIKINSGFWGRKERHVCRHRSVIDCGLKTTSKITEGLSKLCDRSSTCKVKAANDKALFGDDPCTGLFKYLEVNYTCVLEDDFDKHPCPSGWVRHNVQHNGVACYGLIQSMKTWPDAQKTCQGHKAELVSIGEKSEQVVATTLMERAWNTDVWIGLSDQKSPNTYTWSDGSSVKWTNWAVGNPRGSWSDEHCVYMNLKRSTKDLMYWRTANCSQEKVFMCKKMLGTKLPPTEEKSDQGACFRGWTLYGNHCYKYYSYPKTWQSARLSCQGIRYAKLASIMTKAENDFIAKLTNNTVWIGLEGRGVFRGHVWVDDEPVSYTNWDIGQPDSYNGREDCTQQYAETGYWSDINCLSKRAYVCKQGLRSSVLVNPSVKPTVVQSSRCKPGWFLFNEKCYFISDDRNSSDYKTWHDAEKFCLKNGGHLTSINSDEEKTFLAQRTRNKLVYSFWIGLHDMAGESIYKWTDGSGYGKFTSWGSHEPNNYHGQEDCIAVLKISGKWNDNHCSSKKAYICKSYTDGKIMGTVLEPAKNVGKDGYCKPGWVPNGQFCYEFHTDETDYRTWRNAKNACEQGTNSSSLGELVSITNEIEQAFITLHLKGAKAPLWLGLNNFHHRSKYFWADNSQFDYFHWNNGHPNFNGRYCTEISPYERDAGRWSSASCTKKNGYICKTAASSTPSADNSTANVPAPTEPSFKCSKEYVQFDESCYKFVNSPQTFDKAREYCQKESAELISINSEFEQALLVFLLERNLGNVWIGLNRKPWSSMKYTDYTVPFYSFWGEGQPDRLPKDRTCVQANVTGAHVGRWDDVDCDLKNPFVCEIYHGEAKITLEENSTCDDDWKKYRKHCYKHYPSGSSWTAARYVCRNEGGDLISIADDQEMDFTMSRFQHRHRYWAWIGLHDRNDEAQYAWSDETPVNYVNWRDGQPNDPRQEQNCVVMDMRTGQWLDWRCTGSYSFICKKPLECSSKLPLKAKMITISNSIAANLSKEQAILDQNNVESSAWCPNTTAMKPKITINLNKMVKISSVTMKGIRVSTWTYRRGYRSYRRSVDIFVKSFFIDYTADGYTWETYSREGKDLRFFANNNGINSVTKVFNPPIMATSIAIRPTVVKGEQLCMKLSLQGCDYVCQSALGMSNWVISKNSITASSAIYPSNAPEYARPKHSGWCAEVNDHNQWIQINFGRTTLVTKIITYGDTEESYVETYKIQVSGDGLEWIYYKQYGGVRVFRGNLHAAHPVTHFLSDPLQGKYIRIIPTSWNKRICMRFELFGCVADCDEPLIVRKGTEVSEVKLTSPDKTSNPDYARMNSQRAWCPTGKGQQFLEVDFGKRVRLRHIVTKGSPLNYGETRRVVTYSLQIFTRRKVWKQYMVDNSIKHIVSGDMKDSTAESKYSFPGKQNDIIVRKLRIYPEKFTEAGICMRIEFFGCLAETEIIPTTPSTEQITKTATLRFPGMKWKDDYRDQNSKAFKETAKSIKDSILDIYGNYDQDTKEGESLREVMVTKLTKGSVIAHLVLVFNPEFAKNENISKPLMEAVKNGKVGKQTVDKNYPVFPDDTNASTGARSGSSSKLSPGIIAVVVVAVLLALLIVVGIGLYWRKKRKSNLYGPKQFNNPILYSSTNTDEFDVE